MSTTIKPTLAFLGATGDCAGYCLAAALTAGHTCRALARTPSKLINSMKNKGVSEESLRNLTIVQGNVRDKSAVKDDVTSNNKAVDIIVSGIGSAPKLQWSIFRPVTLEDPTICADATETVLDVLAEVNSSTKPLVIVISTTGLHTTGAPRDLPFLFIPLYRVALAVPHEDKAKMEDHLRVAISEQTHRQPIGGFVAVKASLLMDGKGTGLQKVRAGSVEKPAIGYTITRIDVGSWIYRNLIAGRVKDEWLNRAVSITA